MARADQVTWLSLDHSKEKGLDWFRGWASMLSAVAWSARGHNIAGSVAAALRQWYDVVLRQSLALFATISAAVIVGFQNRQPLSAGQVWIASPFSASPYFFCVFALFNVSLTVGLVLARQLFSVGSIVSSATLVASFSLFRAHLLRTFGPLLALLFERQFVIFAKRNFGVGLLESFKILCLPAISRFNDLRTVGQIVTGVVASIAQPLARELAFNFRAALSANDEPRFLRHVSIIVQGV